MITTILLACLPVFLIVFIGVAMRRTGVLTAAADASIFGLIMKLFYPCLIFSSIVKNDFLKNPSNLLIPPAMGFAMIAIGYLVAWIVARACRCQRGVETRSFVFVTANHNSGYMPIPLLAMIFGEQVLGVMFVFNIGVEIALWIGAGLIYSQRKGESLMKKIFNVPVITILVSVALNLLGAGEIMPDWLMRSTKMLGGAMLPLVLILIGAMTLDAYYEARQNPLRGGSYKVAAACFTRLGLLPLILIGLGSFIVCPAEVRQVLLVQAAMPAAMLPIVLARQYKADLRLTLAIVIATTLLAIATIPFWVSIGRTWLGI